jgi:hypothetical protein
MEAVVKALKGIAPTYPFDAVQDQRVPFITYQHSEIPIRTKDGIAGYEGTMSVSVYATSLMAAEALANRVIEAVDGRKFDTLTLYYNDVADADYPDNGISSKELTFNTLR